MTEPISFSTPRIGAGFTVESLAEEYGLSLATVRGWEEGTAQLPQHISRSHDLIS